VGAVLRFDGIDLNSVSIEGLREKATRVGETGRFGARSISEGIENNGGTGNPYTAKATGATTTAEKLIANGGIGALTHDRSGSG
jgi:hypothetical protein